jgi:hypothetical protein
MLRRALKRRVGDASAGAVLLRLILAAFLAAAFARGLLFVLPPLPRLLALVVALAPFGALYFGFASLFGVDEVKSAVSRIARRFGVRVR